MKIQIGKTKITVKAEGCFGCGTNCSHDWGEAKTISVTVGKKTELLSIPICGDCMGVPNPYDEDDSS